MFETFQLFLKYYTFTILIWGFLTVKADNKRESALHYSKLDMLLTVALMGGSVFAAYKLFSVPMPLGNIDFIYLAPGLALLITFVFHVVLTKSKKAFKDQLTWPAGVAFLSFFFAMLIMAIVFKAKQYLFSAPL
ncbi:putative integral membrane protein [Elusimicrobium posterum]|uniref:hypothetical protein n=1 Tax=Elusimicrobium posterum TaxID=3116653 RepID=UPI003C73D9B6